VCAGELEVEASVVLSCTDTDVRSGPSNSARASSKSSADLTSAALAASFYLVDSFHSVGHVRMLDSAYWRAIESNREPSCRSNITILPLPTHRQPA
jgi:hypothetical protein